MLAEACCQETDALRAEIWATTDEVASLRQLVLRSLAGGNPGVSAAGSAPPPPLPAPPSAAVVGSPGVRVRVAARAAAPPSGPAPDTRHGLAGGVSPGVTGHSPHRGVAPAGLPMSTREAEALLVAGARDAARAAAASTPVVVAPAAAPAVVGASVGAGTPAGPPGRATSAWGHGSSVGSGWGGWGGGGGAGAQPGAGVGGSAGGADWRSLLGPAGEVRVGSTTGASFRGGGGSGDGVGGAGSGGGGARGVGLQRPVSAARSALDALSMSTVRGGDGDGDSARRSLRSDSASSYGSLFGR